MGYKLIPPATQLMIADPKSIALLRAEFADHHVFVTKYKDGELYSGGNFTNQSHGKASGIRSWIARQDNVVNEDLVLWCSFGLTHNPRVEDLCVISAVRRPA